MLDLIGAVVRRMPSWAWDELNRRPDHIHERAAADHSDRQPAADRVGQHHALKSLRARNAFAIGRQQEIAYENAGPCCRAIRFDLCDAQTELLTGALRNKPKAFAPSPSWRGAGMGARSRQVRSSHDRSPQLGVIAAHCERRRHQRTLAA